MVAADVDVEALVRWPLSLVAQVPFAGEKGLVAMLFERLGDGDFLERKVAAILGVEQGVGGAVRLAGDPVGDIDANRMAAGHDAGACRTADGAGGVALCEAHAAPGQAIDVWRLVIRAAVGPDVGPAHVVHEKKQEVGLLGCVKRRCGCDENAEGTEVQRDAEFCCFHCLKSVSVR